MHGLEYPSKGVKRTEQDKAMCPIVLEVRQKYVEQLTLFESDFQSVSAVCVLLL